MANQGSLASLGQSGEHNSVGAAMGIITSSMGMPWFAGIVGGKGVRGVIVLGSG